MALQDWDRDAFPRPRSPAVPSMAGGRLLQPAFLVGPPLPEVKVFPFVLSVNAADRRSTVVSAAYRGPAFLSEVVWTSGAFANDAGGLSLWWAIDDSGAKTNDPDLTLPAGVPILDENRVRHAVNSDLDGTLHNLPFIWDGANTTRTFQSKLGFPILAEEFFIKVSIRGTNVVVHAGVTGFIRILEQVDPETLLNLL